MTEREVVNLYVQDIMRRVGAGFLPRGFKADPKAMQIAKLQDVWRRIG